MNKHERERITFQAARLEAMGFSSDEAETLRRASMTLSRWAERECNGEIERDEATGKPYGVSQGCAPHWRVTRWVIPDREAGAIRRIEAILAKHPALAWYHQRDPRGAAVYIYRKDKLEGRDIGCIYSTIGIAVY